jgi:hypothetical protein
MLRRIRYQRFFALLESFEFEKDVVSWCSSIVMSLSHLVNFPAYPTEPQLAAIVGQVSLDWGCVL